MTLFIARFESNSKYHCDAETIGVFSTNEKAEAAITKRIEDDKFCNRNYPHRMEQIRHYYSITECELDEEI